MVETGDIVELEVGAVAHGGHCVARLPDDGGRGRVVFVRHTLPGERVRARLTEAAPEARYWRADAEEVIEASPDRVPSVWPEAGPGGVGGGELSHVALPAQRAWKAAVVTEQLSRLGGVDRDVVVEAAPGDDARGGLAWRTRIELSVDDAGRAGMTRSRTHDVVPLESMPLAHEGLDPLGLFSRRWPRGTRLEAVAPSTGEPLVLVDGVPFRGGKPDTRPNARTSVTEVVRVGEAEHRYRVAGRGFWQVHRDAPGVLVASVLDAVGDVDGARVVDLYSGAGLLTVPLAHAVGPAGSVLAVEGDARAVKDARRNVHGLGHVTLEEGEVARTLAGSAGRLAADVVVLDPPRQGAGRTVVAAVAASGARRVVYVACDPAALARDVAYLHGHGFALGAVRAFDLFPMTHHVECVAVLDRV
ncbi:MAG: class I SAM-dependent RNA methyltransferase [Actinomycetales bacterium]|nr:class I SAM-dependent RNA methyltransferase [Actinomycetales bacterium]